MRNLDQIISSLPADRRAKVTSRGRKLVAEELALRHLREARAFTQQNMATMLDLDQASISKIERRSDMLLSTLRSYVEAMGGSLRLTAEFADGAVELATIGEVSDRAPAMKRSPRKAAKRPALVVAG